MSNNTIAQKLTKEELMQLENYDPEYKVNVRFAPCKDCTNRHLGCHAKCYKYQVYRQARDEYNAVARKEHDSDTYNYFCDLSKPYRRDYASKRKHRK